MHKTIEDEEQKQRGAIVRAKKAQETISELVSGWEQLDGSTDTAAIVEDGGIVTNISAVTATIEQHGTLEKFGLKALTAWSHVLLHDIEAKCVAGRGSVEDLKRTQTVVLTMKSVSSDVNHKLIKMRTQRMEMMD